VNPDEQRRFRGLERRVDTLERRDRSTLHQVWTQPNGGVAADLVTLGAGNLEITVQPIPLIAPMEVVRMGLVAQRSAGAPNISAAIYRSRYPRIDRDDIVIADQSNLELVAKGASLNLSAGTVFRYRPAVFNAWLDPSLGSYYVAVMSDDQGNTTWLCPGAGAIGVNLQARRALPAAINIETFPSELTLTGSHEDAPAVVLWDPLGVYLFGRDED